jgi:hypothetical protein
MKSDLLLHRPLGEAAASVGIVVSATGQKLTGQLSWPVECEAF